jgi:hypothetical protein
LDHGYAVTSYSSQGQTADRVLIQCGHRAGGRKARQSSLGIRCGIAWPLRRANLYQR